MRWCPKPRENAFAIAAVDKQSALPGDLSDGSFCISPTQADPLLAAIICTAAIPSIILHYSILHPLLLHKSAATQPIEPSVDAL